MVRSRAGSRDDYKDFSVVRHREEWDLMEPVWVKSTPRIPSRERSGR
jgi:hypothetical protein